MNKAGKLGRCAWCESDPLYIIYHDREWGVPVHDDRHLFEMLILEGAQAGLSWITILKKRENYRKAFDNFDATRIARYDKRRIKKLLANEGIVRNRLKIEATVTNAKAFLAVQKEFGSFDLYIWQFAPLYGSASSNPAQRRNPRQREVPQSGIGGKQKKNAWRALRQIPPTTRESDALSKDLKRRGFTFVGSTICYAFMQAVGMVNDHLTSCYRYSEVGQAR